MNHSIKDKPFFHQMQALCGALHRTRQCSFRASWWLASNKGVWGHANSVHYPTDYEYVTDEHNMRQRAIFQRFAS